MKTVRSVATSLDLSPEFLKRGVNEGFSGGEKKRNEILQLLMLQPKLAILDETDSGLDIDALQTVAAGVNRFRGAGQRHPARHALPTPARLHQTRYRARARRRPHREERRSHSRAEARTTGLRLDHRRRVSVVMQSPAVHRFRVGAFPATRRPPAVDRQRATQQHRRDRPRGYSFGQARNLEIHADPAILRRAVRRRRSTNEHTGARRPFCRSPARCRSLDGAEPPPIRCTECRRRPRHARVRR